jgi:putative ABC transport system substrate-binding protein
MKRRKVITLLCGAAAWPLAARAQQLQRTRRIGVLSPFDEDDAESKTWLAAFQQGCEKLGWSEGRNVRIDYRFTAGSVDRSEPLAKELLALRPDVVLTVSTEIAAVLQQESRTIPIVFVGVSDPIGSGFVASLARPGGNLTGLLNYEAGITGKWLAMLREIAPRLTRVALVANPKTTPYDYWRRAAEAAVPSLAIELVPTPVETPADIERAIMLFAGAPNGGLFLPPDATTILRRDLVIALAAQHRLPAVYSARHFAVAGGLMSYGSDRAEMYRQAASYVDRILRGANPADLPVQAPTKYQTTLNMKTAKALDLEVPPSLLVRADEVIE